jgi:hypothetical protein
LEPGREILAEDDEAGGDRTALVASVANPAAVSASPCLEGSLEDAGAERVADDQRENCEPGAAVDDELRRYVAAGEEQAGGEAERRCAREPGAEERERRSGG